MTRLPDEFFGFDEDFFDMFENMMRPLRKRRRNRSNLDINRDYMRPRIDVYEEDNSYIVKCDLPGVNKEDIDLNVNENEIEIKVKRNDEAEYKDKKKGFHRIERKSFGFYRKLPMPEEINPEETTAKYNKGVLEIIAPKKNGDSSKTKIDIK